MFFVFEGMLFMYSPVDFGGRGLNDTDSYSRFNRVLYLLDSKDWYDVHYPRSNAPYGEVSHWTRPLDVMLLAGAWLLSPLGSFQSGLYWWSVVMSPLLFGVALYGMFWMVHSFFDRETVILLSALFLMQPALVAYFLPGRPDHHSLLLACFVWILAITSKLLSRRFDSVWCCSLGAVGALAIWVSIEAFVGVGICLFLMAIYWIVEKKDFSAKITVALGVMWLILTPALFIERPWNQIMVEEYDRYSIVHWFVLSLMMALWVGISVVERRFEMCRSLVNRFGVALVGGMTVCVALWVSYPKFFHGPLVDVDPMVMNLLWKRVSETQPLLSWDSGKIGRFLFFLGIALPGVLYLLWLLRQEWGKPTHGFWVLIGIGHLVFIPLAIKEVRWAAYTEILLVIPYACLVREMLRKVEKSKLIYWKSAVTSLLGVLFVLGPLTLGAMAKNWEQGETKSWKANCPLAPLSQFLSDPSGLGARPRIILTFVDFGPELLYRTPHSIVSTPSHRNVQGFLDTLRVMAARDDTVAKQILLDRKVDLILLCPAGLERNVFASYSGQAPWYDKLRDGNVPSWIRKVPLSSDLQPDFKLFEVAIPDTSQAHAVARPSASPK